METTLSPLLETALALAPSYNPNNTPRKKRRRKGEKRNATGNMFETKWKISTRLIQRFLKQSTKKVKRFFFWQLISYQKTKKNAVKTTY